MASVSKQARGCDDSDWGPTKGFGNPKPKSPTVLCPAKSTVKSGASGTLGLPFPPHPGCRVELSGSCKI